MQHDSHLRWFRCIGGGRGTAGGRCWTRRRCGPGQHHFEETIAHSSKQRMRSALRQTTSHVFFHKSVSDTNKYCTIPHVGFSTFSWAKSTTALRRKRQPRRSADGHTLPSAGETHGRRQRRPLSRRRARPAVASRIVAMTIRKPLRDTSEKRDFAGAGKQMTDGGGCDAVFPQPHGSTANYERRRKKFNEREAGSSFFLIFLHDSGIFFFLFYILSAFIIYLIQATGFFFYP